MSKKRKLLNSNNRIIAKERSPTRKHQDKNKIMGQWRASLMFFSHLTALAQHLDDLELRNHNRVHAGRV